MKSRLRPVLLALLAFALAAVVFNALRPREPVYQGRTLSAWLEDLVSGTDGAQHDMAVEAVQQIGTNAIPELIQLICFRDSAWKKWLQKNSARLGIRLSLWNQDKDFTRGYAGFQALGRDAKSAIPTLVEMLGSNGNTRPASLALVAIGKDSVPALAGALRHPAGYTRLVAVASLRDLGSLAEDAVPDLVLTLNDTDRDIRKYAVIALGRIKRRMDITVPALIGALKSPDLSVRLAAAEALGELGPMAESGRGTLEEALQDSESQVRNAAISAIKKLDSPEIK